MHALILQGKNLGLNGLSKCYLIILMFDCVFIYTK